MQLKAQQASQQESALNSYMNPPLTHKERRGESSKSRASVRSNPHGTGENAVTINNSSGIGNNVNPLTMQGAGSSKQYSHNKFNIKDSHKGTPGQMVSNKI